MKPTKKQQQLAFATGLAAIGTMAVLAFSPLGNFFMSSLFGGNPTTSDSGLYLGNVQHTASGDVMRVGTGVHLGSNDTRYGTGSTVSLRAEVTLATRTLDVNSFNGVISYDANDISIGNNAIHFTGSGFTLDPAITRVVRNADGSEAGKLYFSVDKNTGNFLKPYHHFMTLDVTPKRVIPTYTLSLDTLRFLDKNGLSTGSGDSLYLDNTTSGVQHIPLNITPGSGYIMERSWDVNNEHHVEETLYTNTDVRYTTTERVYDSTDGHLLRETITYYNPDGTPAREIYHEYYPDGVTIRYERDTVYNPDGTRTVTERTYDENGNQTSENTHTEGTPTQVPVNNLPVVTLTPAQNITTTSATFNWTGSQVDPGETFSYRFCLSTSAANLLQNCTAASAATTMTRNDLTTGTPYFWTVLVSDGTTTDVPAANGPLSFTTVNTPPPPSSGGGGSSTPPPASSGNGSGGGFNTWDGDLVLPTTDDGRSLIVYGALDFRNSQGMVNIAIRHIDQLTGWEATYARGTKVANADGSGYTGKYLPLIRYPFSNLREPMKSALPAGYVPAYDYLLQYGNLAETFTPSVYIKGNVGDLQTPREQIAIMMWDFQQQKWVQIADGNAIDNKGVLTVPVDKSTILAVMKKTITSANTTTTDICDDAKNPNRTPFRDANSHWATAYICKLYNLGAITGYTDGPFKGLFRPDNSVTRAELLKIIMAAEGITVDTSRVNSGFPDVPTYEWFAPYVATAREQHLVDGYPDGTFQPFRQINRSEALKIILNAAKQIDKTELVNKVNQYKANPPARSVFNDITTSDWFAPYIDLAAGKGIISGKQPGIFRAGDDMTRAEVSKVIQLVITLP